MREPENRAKLGATEKTSLPGAGMSAPNTPSGAGGEGAGVDCAATSFSGASPAWAPNGQDARAAVAPANAPQKLKEGADGLCILVEPPVRVALFRMLMFFLFGALRGGALGLEAKKKDAV